MITLAAPAVINSVLGGNAPIDYGKFVLSSITYDTVAKTVSAQIVLSSTSNPDMQAITGSMSINCTTAKLTIAVPQIDFYRQVVLTGPQNTFVVDNCIRASQNTLENGLLTLSVVAGSQATGA